MVAVLAKIFIKEEQDQRKIRQSYGMLCGMLGIVLNILLFTGKFFAGMLSRSIAITADAFNNLSDAGSSAVTLAGFKLAGAKPGPEHPFGHGRIECISGLIVAAAILLMDRERTITAVAEELGYASPEHFSAAFRQFYGMSPREYRKAAQSGSV